MSGVVAGLAASIIVTAAAAVRHRACRPARVVHLERSGASRRSSRLVALAIAGVVVAVVVGPLPSLVGAAIALFVRLTRPVLAARHARRSADRALPDAIDLLVLSVRAGLTPQQAVRELAMSAPNEVRPAFALVVHRNDRGQAFADSLTALPETLGSSALALADVLATSERYGLAVGPMLDQLANEARTARRRLDEADARRLPVRLAFPLVTCTLPSFVLLAIAPAVIAALSSLGSSAW